jgi:hypothetical protein
MWEFFDPEIQRQLTLLKHVTMLRQQAPVREWPLFVDGNTVFVVREWPNGEVTAYLATRR